MVVNEQSNSNHVGVKSNTHQNDVRLTMHFHEHFVFPNFGDGMIDGVQQRQSLMRRGRQMLQRFLASTFRDPISQFRHQCLQFVEIRIEDGLQFRHDGTVEMLWHVTPIHAGVRVDGDVNLLGTQTWTQHGNGQNCWRTLQLV